MAVVWVKRGDEALRFPLDGSKLMVGAIARHWGLDPDSLRIGDCALVPGPDGNSMLSLDDIAAMIQEQGDGSSREQALLITGRRCSAATYVHPAVQDLIRQRDEKDLVARKKQRREAAESRWYKACKSSVAGLWSYVKELEPEGMKPEQVRSVLQSRVSKMVPRLHFVEGDDEPSDDNYRGLAALVKPDGSCFTAAVCCDRSSTSGKHVLVFPDPPLEYECVVTYEEAIEQLAILTPTKPVSFNYCINWTDWVAKSGEAYSWKRDPESGDIKCVPGIFLEDRTLTTGECVPYRMVMLPVESTVEVGAPVLDDEGSLGGVVVEFEEIPARDTRSTKKKKKGERRLDQTAIRDKFQRRVEEDPDFGKDLEAGLRHRKAVVYVGCVDIAGLITVCDDWARAHPLKEFEL